eukprot:scaffold3472_cov68-Cylindrotheca_fusiformis.AAC.3
MGMLKEQYIQGSDGNAMQADKPDKISKQQGDDGDASHEYVVQAYMDFDLSKALEGTRSAATTSLVTCPCDEKDIDSAMICFGMLDGRTYSNWADYHDQANLWWGEGPCLTLCYVRKGHG